MPSEQVKERLRGVGTGGRSASTSALEAVKVGSGGVRCSLCEWSWSLFRHCDFTMDPYSGLSNISDIFSNSPLGNDSTVSISLHSIVNAQTAPGRGTHAEFRTFPVGLRVATSWPPFLNSLLPWLAMGTFFGGML